MSKSCHDFIESESNHKNYRVTSSDWFVLSSRCNLNMKRSQTPENSQEEDLEA